MNLDFENFSFVGKERKESKFRDFLGCGIINFSQEFKECIRKG